MNFNQGAIYALILPLRLVFARFFESTRTIWRQKVNQRVKYIESEEELIRDPEGFATTYNWLLYNINPWTSLKTLSCCNGPR